MARSILLSMFSLGVLAIGGALSPAAAGDVRIGVHIGGPPVVVAPPAPVYVAPPVVIVPGTPIYYYGTSYYTFHNGAWFLTPSYGSPWAYVPRGHVPHAIVGVPRAYHRIPHHQATHFAGPHPWAHQQRDWQGHRNSHRKHDGKHHGRHRRDRD
ncbi:MAG: hypothetical protein ACREF4_01280 [Gammaproteobacteria bacterium]